MKASLTASIALAFVFLSAIASGAGGTPEAGLSAQAPKPALAEAKPVDFERIVPPDLSPEQRASVNLEPEFSDAFYGQTDRLYLYGFWKFKPVLNLLKREGSKIVPVDSKPSLPPDSDAGLEEGFFRPEFDASSWEEIPVPWAWNLPLGKKFKSSQAPRSAFAGLGYYRTSFAVPKEKAGKRALLHFDSVNSLCKVWFNGVLAGEHANAKYTTASPWLFGRKTWMDSFELDVTELVKYGEPNVLVIRVFDDGLPISWNAIPTGGGIVAPAYVDFRESVDFDEMLVAADLDGSVKIQARAVNKGEDAELSLAALVEPFSSRFYSPPTAAKASRIELGHARFPKGESRHSFSMKVQDPVPWDVNCPSLYRLRLSDGKRVLAQTRIGFRRMEVVGDKFLLNGRPIALRGMQAEPWSDYQQILVFNKADIVRQGCALLKEAGFNAWRDNGGFQPQNLTQIVLDVCDELGLIVQTDFSPEIRMLDPEERRPEALTAIKLGETLNPDGSISPYGREVLREWLAYAHNHPSVCFFTGGNEIGFPKGETEKTMADFISAFYSFMKESDLQGRPVASSAGLMIYGAWKTPVPSDYYDYHCYAEEVMGYMDFSTTNRDAVYKRLAGIYGSVEKPVILGECLGYTSRPSNLRPDLQALCKGGRLDRRAYVKWANSNNESPLTDYWDIVARQGYCAYAGVRSAVSREALTLSTAKIASGFLQRLRRDIDFHAGFMTTRIDFTNWGLEPRDVFLSPEQVKGELMAKARRSPEFIAERESLAPLALLPDLHDRHRFAGEDLTLRFLLVNEQYATPEPSLLAEISLEDRDGRALCSVKGSFSQVQEGARIERVLTLRIPERVASGPCVLRSKLLRGSSVVHESSSPFFVTERSKASVKSSCKLALYDVNGAKARSTKAVLDDLSIPYAQVESMDSLDSFELLIVGAGSLDSKLTKDAPRLRAWLEKGGKLLCFEQTASGEVPFLKEMRYKGAGMMVFADLIDPEHPCAAGLGPDSWELWNGDCVKRDGAVDASPKAVYDTLLLPMPEGVVVAGANRTWRSKGDPLVFGMISGELKLGKGLVFFSQPLATARYGEDPVATRYMRNVLEYTLSPLWNGENAAPLRLEPAREGAGPKAGL